MNEKITNKRFKLFIEKLGYTEEEYFKKKDINFSLKYMFFTNHMAQNYLKINYLNEIDELKEVINNE